LEVPEAEVAAGARAATAEEAATGLVPGVARRRCGGGGLGAVARHGGGAADGRECRPAREVPTSEVEADFL
jgi:hypothetical protein